MNCVSNEAVLLRSESIQIYNFDQLEMLDIVIRFIIAIFVFYHYKVIRLIQFPCCCDEFLDYYLLMVQDFRQWVFQNVILKSMAFNPQIIILDVTKLFRFFSLNSLT